MSLQRDASMLDLFRQELETQIDLITEGLLQIERRPDQTAHVDAMMRAAHSAKGAARLVGLDAAVKLAHALESCFVAVGAQRLTLAPESCDTLLAGVDALSRFAKFQPDTTDAWLAERTVEVQQHVRAIHIVEHGESAGETADEPPNTTATPTVRAPSAPPSSVWEVYVAEAREPLDRLEKLAARLAPGPSQEGHAAQCERWAERLAALAHIASARPAERVANAVRALCTARITSEDAAVADAIRDALDTLRLSLDLSPVEIDARAASWAPRIEAWERLAGASPVRTERAETTQRRTEIPHVAPDTVTPSSAPSPPEAASPRVAAATPTRAVARPATSRGSPARQELTREADRFVRVTSENLDRLMGLAAETLVQVNWLQPYADSLVELKRGQEALGRHLETLLEIASQTSDGRSDETIRSAARELMGAREVLAQRLTEIEEYARRSVGLSDRLYHEVIDSRMRPLADGLRGLPRLVRDLARQLGKSAHLEIVGADTEVDRDILERLEAPLNHLLRNAVDHGIESPAERVANGKSRDGQLRLEASHRSGMLSIQLVDDGRGIDIERIRRKVVARELASEEAASELADAELIDFLFTPGFSTADDVTETSGRGVGLDVVRATVGEVGGSIHAVTRRGEGTRFQMELPLTLSVVRTLLVRISGEIYAFPLTRVEQVLHPHSDETFTVQSRLCCTWNGHNVGLVPAAQVLGLPPRSTESNELHVVCVNDRTLRYGICVDELIGEQNLVVRPLDSRLGKVPDVSAAAIMSDGSLVIILDVDDMMRSIARLKVGGRLTAPDRGRQALPLIRKRVLVVDDSGPVRELESRVLEKEGYEVVGAVDGEDAWAQLTTSHFDLLVSDVDMPRLNGFDLVRRIRAAPALADLPIVLVSYSETDEYRREGLAHGADRYVTKSEITTGVWLETVVELVGKPMDEDRDRL